MRMTGRTISVIRAISTTWRSIFPSCASLRAFPAGPGSTTWSACCFATPGSGWEMFLQFGNTLLQDKIMLGLSRGIFGVPFEELIAEYEALPLKDSVREKWFYRNALTFLRRG